MNSKTIRMGIKKMSTILTIMVVGLIVLSSCSSDENEFQSAVVETEQSAEEADENSDVSSDGLPNNLEKCTAYSEKFIHPFTSEELTKEVVGLDANGLCEYKEEMPNGGLMQCTYSEETRKVIAQYYKDIARSGPGSLGAPPSASGSKTYTIDGKSVMNPLDEVMNNGDCTISGY